MPRLKKSLQTLPQVDGNQILIASSGVLDVKTNLPPKDVTKRKAAPGKRPILADLSQKENSPIGTMPRRSQRKGSKSKSSLSSVMKAFTKSHSENKKKKSDSSDITQVLPAVGELLSIIPEELESTDNFVAEDEVFEVLTTDKVSLNYWRHLAEQRRLDLEKALQENEDLHDQIEVMETDNNELRSIVDLGEKLSNILKDLLENS